MEEGDALPTVERTVTQSDIHRYAEASGDFNPVHVDPEFAAASPFGSTVAHGMMVISMVSQTMTAAFGDAWVETGKLKVRFRAPVRPGDTIASYGRVTSVRPENGAKRVGCSVAVQRRDGEDAVTGQASVVLKE